MIEKIEDAISGALSVLSSESVSAGLVPADAPSGRVYFSAEKLTVSDGVSAVSARIRYFPKNIPSVSDGALIYELIGKLTVSGTELTPDRFECRPALRHVDITAVYTLPNGYRYGNEADDGEISGDIGGDTVSAHGMMGEMKIIFSEVQNEA